MNLIALIFYLVLWYSEVEFKIELLIESAAYLHCRSLYRAMGSLCWEIRVIADRIFCHSGICFKFLPWTFPLWPPHHQLSIKHWILLIPVLMYIQNCQFFSILTDTSFCQVTTVWGGKNWERLWNGQKRLVGVLSAQPPGLFAFHFLWAPGQPCEL